MKKFFTGFKEDFEIIRQGLKLVKIYLGKNYFSLNLIVKILRAVSPYITIYCTGLVITALTEKQGFEQILKYVLIATISTLVIDIIIRTINRKALIMLNSCWEKHSALLSRKALELDYAKAESSSVQELRGKIEENANNGNGLTWVAECVAEMVSCVFSIIVAIVMISGMVFSKSPAPLTGFMAFVDSPLLGMSLVIFSAVMIALSVKYHSLSEKKQFNIFNRVVKFNPILEYYNQKYLNENESGKDVRIFNEKGLINEEITEKIYNPTAKMRKDTFRVWATIGQISTISTNLLGGLVYIFVGLKALAGAFGAGKVVEYYGAITKLITACTDIAGNAGYLHANNAQLKQEIEYLNLVSDMENGTKTVDGIDPANSVFEFHNVSFVYPETEPMILKNFSMKIKSGERLAVVGMNGSGKSTMIKLLCRLYDPTEGRITLNGIDIREFDYAEYLKLFAIVFQDFKLLAFPVGENVACSDEYDEERVWQCLEMAGVKDRVEEFPKKLKQSIYKLYEKDGIDLSGGEEQKIAIARALYKDAPFVILDEPTAALDPIAESEIYSRFNDIAGGKTAVYISHRLSSCRFCSRIVVFDNGSVIQEGTHEELLEDTNGKYSELWNAQAQYYAENTEKVGE
ncbi:MAG: ABC transporter ATP-binding protein [Clostridia bacterium]|nr:ABC transporter ATP-binding protein [Clostridia bacterium]